ncbi:hypothetical protein EB796_000513 [Bugula neritina]|uniref:Transmembrane protein n=1 Tax=Bugula neritina TaxID=10212 RepID=A0A7J7KSV3_BUGNE|nr:hypothetical protein EB796_000513 [Bugula neritina]
MSHTRSCFNLNPSIKSLNKVVHFTMFLFHFVLLYEFCVKSIHFYFVLKTILIMIQEVLIAMYIYQFVFSIAIKKVMFIILYFCNYQARQIISLEFVCRLLIILLFKYVCVL